MAAVKLQVWPISISIKKFSLPILCISAEILPLWPRINT